jgi:general secretion pathway protein J
MNAVRATGGARTAPQARGFTLIELLMSVLLLGLLVVGAYSAIRTATKAAVSGEALISRTEKLRMAQQFLRRQLSQSLALPYGEPDFTTSQRKMFEGSRDELDFVSPMPGYLGHGGPYVQRLTFERTNNGTALVFRHAMANGFEPDKLDDPARKPVVLLEFIRQGRFQYRALDDTGKLGSWQSDWDKPGQMPLLVRIEIEFERGRGMDWPELVIPLMVDPSAVGAALEPSFFTGR